MAQVMGSPLTPRKIEKLYDKLFPLTQSEASEKLLHVETIDEKYRQFNR